ncbi:hypothetical protein NP493_14g07032 [Ridgeia piscesae]|uniref:Fucosyltransferase n=1 Tax=Ridgeia piscesae TaxID=27915 RepID=A0AAD9UKT1_RIDPI|nr:hypothetical protein NP493_14g07032 [Ridgeia piscesae]
MIAQSPSTRLPGLLYGTLILLLATAFYVIFGTTFIKRPHNTLSMFPSKAYGYADRLNVVFPERKERPIKVLYWTTLWGNRKDWKFETSIARECPVLNSVCKFTTDHRQYNDSDVVLFHIGSSYEIPKYRPSFQKWVFVIIESPFNTHRYLSQERWLYNITMTYTRVSDVSFVYGECRRRDPNATKKPVKYNYAQGKKHLVAWFVSNCNTQSKREVYARELAKHIDIHKFGCGGKHSCPRTKEAYCDTVLLNQTYKFYLSFENSLCTDYITEKVYRILDLNVVPIVLGYSHYSDLLPPYSFIDVRDFDSPKSLAVYLEMLSNNDTEYNKYFAWKETHKCRRMPGPACNLCRYVQRQRQRTQVADVVEFWDHNTNCIDAKQFYHDMIAV